MRINIQCVKLLSTELVGWPFQHDPPRAHADDSVSEPPGKLNLVKAAQNSDSLFATELAQESQRDVGSFRVEAGQ